MHESHFDELVFFQTIANSGARALLIGRQALIALGIPVMTSDYDLWIHRDDAEKLNLALEPLGFLPSHAPAEARARGRYVLQNDEKVDVMVAKAVSTVDGARVEFDALWSRRVALPLSDDVSLLLPELADLIATKRFASRPKDAEDIRLLHTLKADQSR